LGEESTRKGSGVRGQGARDLRLTIYYLVMAGGKREICGEIVRNCVDGRGRKGIIGGASIRLRNPGCVQDFAAAGKLPAKRMAGKRRDRGCSVLDCGLLGGV